ncbi:TetR/AcrR family transcriptional regulator [Paenibacillus sp. DR312]|uniref:TetR/AcrR family transcriptional regulator n=2 Tax=Paenibacillus TaxID=44249 RepID=UPI000B82AD5E|nr:TetR/AcrR family transcriptional regulator [Paenibacillus sp. DR312]PRA09473.1 TetR/AcrR family transcriptional regulator [Paenibacillus sp. MYb63]PRA46227.1 TetR/AcrR family transcriptional regulator [Paenibacillus sp. MYb67]QZN73699.1 TetR/AcrR family transcriptional regulator [Paenibacillus sp. DR312]
MRMKRRLSIIEAAKTVFSHQGFEKSTMQEIATEANLGIATIFRYFPKKEHLIVAVASKIVESEVNAFEEIVYGQGTCYDKLERIFDIMNFQEAKHQNNSKLIEAFECYVALSKEPLEDIHLYKAQYDKLINLFSKLSGLGELDGSIRKDNDTVDTLITMLHVFGNFSKKMSMLSGIDAFHTQVDPSEQFRILKNLFLEQLKP